jgi:hypothetical protein
LYHQQEHFRIERRVSVLEKRVTDLEQRHRVNAL